MAWYNLLSLLRKYSKADEEKVLEREETGGWSFDEIPKTKSTRPQRLKCIRLLEEHLQSVRLINLKIPHWKARSRYNLDSERHCFDAEQ
tara:strand:- start:827 stop:1093 length:267 start_codon:yes stop_codon:yes gene_type:complete